MSEAPWAIPSIQPPSPEGMGSPFSALGGSDGPWGQGADINEGELPAHLRFAMFPLVHPHAVSRQSRDTASDCGPARSEWLVEIMDTWTLQGCLAAGYLLRLYRDLGDDRQAAAALMAAAPCEERARRFRLDRRISGARSSFLVTLSEEVWREALSWELLVEAHAGVLAFHAVVDPDAVGARGLRGSRTATSKALRRSIQGYRTAFPEAMAEAGIHRAVNRAIAGFTEAFTGSLQIASNADRSRILEDLSTAILAFLSEDIGSSPIL